MGRKIIKKGWLYEYEETAEKRHSCKYPWLIFVV